MDTSGEGTDKPGGGAATNNCVIGGQLSFFVDIILAIYTVGFIFFRMGEIIPLVGYYPYQCLTALVLFLTPSIGRRKKQFLHLASLIVLAYIVDRHIPKPLPAALNGANLKTKKTVVITGANSGVGYETSRQLAVTYGMDVIMGCRSEAKCAKAAGNINDEISTLSGSSSRTAGGFGKAIPLVVNLSDFKSVKSFASQLKRRRIDVLLNNAGYAPSANLPVNKYGLDPAFTTMHLSHYLLTELLLRKNPSMRIVNTSSATHHLCALPFAYMPPAVLNVIDIPQNPGCVDEDYLTRKLYTETDAATYIEAKIANVLHVVEIPRRHPRSTSIAIDLGWVGTSIQPFMKGTLTPTDLGWMRSASDGVLPVLHAILSSDEELMEEMGGGRQWKDGGIMMNVFGRPEEPFSYPWWTAEGASANVGSVRMMELGKLLWEVSAKLLKSNGY